MEINRLSIKAADYAIPNEFNNLISEMGGSGLNAFTSYDETVYHNMFLPDYFEQWAELNSERIMNPVFRLECLPDADAAQTSYKAIFG